MNLRSQTPFHSKLLILDLLFYLCKYFPSFCRDVFLTEFFNVHYTGVFVVGGLLIFCVVFLILCKGVRVFGKVSRNFQLIQFLAEFL